MKKYDTETLVLNSPFDMEVHKKTFINYLEVVILKDGTIEYATPSHQLKVTDIIANERNISRNDVADLCPPAYYCNYANWLCREAKALMVWDNFYLGEPNIVQIATLIQLIEAKLYKGKLDIDRLINY